MNEEELIEKMRWNETLTWQERSFATNSSSDVVREAYRQYTYRETKRIIEASRKK